MDKIKEILLKEAMIPNDKCKSCKFFHTHPYANCNTCSGNNHYVRKEDDN